MRRLSGVAVLFALLFAFSAQSEEAAKPATDPGDEAVRAARTFLRTVGRNDDKAAYQLTAPSYREKNSAEEFGKRAAKLRDAAGLKEVPPVSGWVLLKPKEGEPGRALLAAGPSLEMRFSVARQGAPSTPIGVELVESPSPGGGVRWLVVDAKSLVTERKDGRVMLAPGMEARNFAEPIRKLARKNSEIAREVGSAVRGEITEVKEGSVAVKLKNGKGEAAGGERKFKTDENTAVVLGVQGQSRQAPRGGLPGSVTTTFRPVKISDLQPGKGTATIEPGGDADDYAMSVNVVMKPGDEGPGL
jgi:hypothetical protein